MSQACSLEQQNAHARLCHASSLYYAISIVHNKLDYCNSLYYKLSKSQLSRLQIQNSLARTVVKAPKFVSYHSHPTRSLHWLRITDSSSISDSLILSLVTFSSSDSPLCLFINPSVFYSRLKTYTCVTNPTPLFHFFSPQTAFMDYCPDRFFWATQFLGRLFDKVDLIKPVSNVHPSLRAYVYVNKKFLGFQWNLAHR